MGEQTCKQKVMRRTWMKLEVQEWGRREKCENCAPNKPWELVDCVTIKGWQNAVKGQALNPALPLDNCGPHFPYL